MRSKSEKVYSLAQVAKMLRKGTTTVYNYAAGGLITLVPGKASASGRPDQGGIGVRVSASKARRG